jgi:hypothetical protein
MMSAGAFLLFLGLVLCRSAFWRGRPLPLRMAINPSSIVADGYRCAVADIARPGPIRGPVRISAMPGLHLVSVMEISETPSGWRARIRAGVTPGRVVLRAEAPGFTAAQAELNATLDAADSEGDGTPDFLRLESESDRQAFLRWFTFLAEAQYFQKPELRPAEIDDCAALIRYAYRESLRQHDGGWARDAALPLVPGLESVTKYQYPHTPLGAALFRIRPGPFLPADLADGAFAQFADAGALLRFNTHRVARAEPGDLFFFQRRQSEMPFHSMIYLGRSQIAEDREEYVVYHTGPDRGHAGEIRRIPLKELLRHPDPRWRPVEGNPVFLGAYRWNILRKAA